MKILIIGSKGFIGSNLLVFCTINSSHNCFGCDITEDYKNGNYFYINPKNISFDDLFKKNKFDICINCSGSANVSDSIINPLYDFDLNVNNVAKILSSIKNFNSNCKFINLSSAAVYGSPKFLPIKELNQLCLISPYGSNKILSEQLCLGYFNYFNIPTVSLRIFSAYGPGLKKQIFWEWYKKSKKNTITLLNGNGNESRDYIYIDDLVRVIDLVIKFSSFEGNCINIANGEEIFINEIAQFYFNYLNKRYSFSGNNYSFNPTNWKADISVIKGWGYKKSVSIENGLQKYIEWVKKLN